MKLQEKIERIEKDIKEGIKFKKKAIQPPVIPEFS